MTPVHPSRESVLAALRSAVLREAPYGPFGALPEKVRVDRGKDFLSRTVTAAFDLLDVTVEDLPATYRVDIADVHDALVGLAGELRRRIDHADHGGDLPRLAVVFEGANVTLRQLTGYWDSYLKRLLAAVGRFEEVFERWMETRVESDHVSSRGVVPTVWTKDGQGQATVCTLELDCPVSRHLLRCR
ncbi:hypothetical protein [Streptomyces sp. NPDC056821]|uniref:hypothetical protein n=1 Tax=unclassified Streptomyces TaxID=2593676 RepID=UPI00367DDF39